MNRYHIFHGAANSESNAVEIDSWVCVQKLEFSRIYFLEFMSWHVHFQMKIHEFFSRKMCGFNAQINVCCYSFRVVNLLNLFCSNRAFFSVLWSSAGRSIHISVTPTASISFEHFSPPQLSKKDEETFIFLRCAIAIMSHHYGHVSKREMKAKKIHICYRKFPLHVSFLPSNLTFNQRVFLPLWMPSNSNWISISGK